MGVNASSGRIRLGKNVVFADGTTLIGNTVQIGNASSVDRVLANQILQGAFVQIRGERGSPTLPIIDPSCTIPTIACTSAPRSARPPWWSTWGGERVRVSQSAVANAALFAPLAQIAFGRDATLLGCFCTHKDKSDKHITLECRQP